MTQNPRFCEFCEDEAKPSIGRMLVIVRDSHEELLSYTDSSFEACEEHGFGHSGAHVLTETDTGREAVFQFQHHDFVDDPEEIALFRIKLSQLCCRICDALIYPPGEPPMWVARRMLQQAPEASELSATCLSCQATYGCPDCEEAGEHQHE